MIPELAHIETKDSRKFWITTDGSIGTGFKIMGLDLETQSLENYLHRIRQCLKQLDTKILVRLKITQKESIDLSDEFPRSEEINLLSFKETEILIFFDYVDSLNLLKGVFTKSDSSSQDRQNGLISAANLFIQQGFNLKPLNTEEVRAFFHKTINNWRAGAKTIETGTQSIGFLRLEKMPFQDFEVQEWVKTLESLPLPNTYHLSFRRLDESVSKLMLERRLKQSASGKDVSSKMQEGTTLDVIQENLKSGSQLFEVEALFEIRRSSEAGVTEAFDKARAKLSLFSETYVETFGATPSYCATMPGNNQHVTFLESDEGLSGILPFPCNGEVTTFKGEPKRALTLHREDRSLYHFDLFSPQYNAFNALIVGPSGKGKSVLLGLLTSSLLNDPNVCIIKLDVGGSHSKECELYGGTEYRLNLETGSGINPFDVLKIAEASENDKIAILSKFLGTLIQEQGEFVLSKALRSEIEAAVRLYIEQLIPEPSLNDFYQRMSEFPRRNLLSRWAEGGLYERAFARFVPDVLDARGEPKEGSESASISGPHVSTTASQRLRYYNFSEIFQASDPEFAQAGIAAVLAQFNMEMLKKNGKRLVLVCDEVPFFIKSCFEFFKFSTANVRKFGHATVLSAQLSADFVVNGDTGIIENSPQRLIFGVDGEESEFQAKFSLAASDIRKIKSLNSINGSHSEFVLQTGDKTRKIKVKVTPQEYWRLTTSRVDKEKILNVMQAVPGISLQETLNCLSTIH